MIVTNIFFLLRFDIIAVHDDGFLDYHSNDGLVHLGGHMHTHKCVATGVSKHLPDRNVPYAMPPLSGHTSATMDI